MVWEEKPPDKDRRDRVDALIHEERDAHTNRKIRQERLERITRQDEREMLDFGPDFS
jgi:hypothetical protein